MKEVFVLTCGFVVLMHVIFLAVLPLSRPLRRWLEARSRASDAIAAAEILIPVFAAVFLWLLVFLPHLPAKFEYAFQCVDRICNTRLGYSFTTLLTAAGGALLLSICLRWIIRIPGIRNGIRPVILPPVEGAKLDQVLDTGDENGPAMSGCIRLFSCARPISFVKGIVRPRVFLSDGLIRSLDVKDLRIILNHERAHIIRWDNLFGLLLSLITDIVWIIPACRRAFRRWCVGREFCCDDYAARAAVSRKAVAATLLRVARLNLRAGNEAGVFTGAASSLLGDGMKTASLLLARIERLTVDQGHEDTDDLAPYLRTLRWVVGAGCLVVLLGILCSGLFANDLRGVYCVWEELFQIHCVLG
ncbi:MAG: M56 family metallopeptidase [Planctomycetes bacterium]|nr:M56 family metallopeptidase [Planctomycetota bacterium]